MGSKRLVYAEKLTDSQLSLPEETNNGQNKEELKTKTDMQISISSPYIRTFEYQFSKFLQRICRTTVVIREFFEH